MTEFLDMSPGMRAALSEIKSKLGDDEALLVARAVRKSRHSAWNRFSLDGSPSFTVSNSLNSAGSRGMAFRREQMIQNRTTRLGQNQLAFGIPPDEIREEYSRFCELMYKGFQHRFLNRHPNEEPEDFLNRPRKRTVNITKKVINTKSLLYVKTPFRSVDGADDNIKKRLEDIWANPLFDQTLLHTDRFTRLLGTTTIRPFYDEESPGKIRLWSFMSHQIRVCPKEDRPWEPAAVIERHQPFRPGGKVIIWTERVFFQFSGDTAKWEPHKMGRIPHTFFKHNMTFQSFFSEGEGRDLCAANCLINDKLSDLNEIIQMQGFAATEMVNPDDDNPVIGPRRGTVFRPEDNTVPFGINFKSPKAPIKELRDDIILEIRTTLQTHNVPDQATMFGASSRLSGVAIRLMMDPIVKENNTRGKFFWPAEVDLSDSMLRVLREHEEGFKYDNSQKKDLGVTVLYQDPDFPVDTIDQVKRDEFDISQGITTPPEIMLGRDNARYRTMENATKQWEENLETIRGSAVPMLDTISEVEELSSQQQSVDQEQEDFLDVLMSVEESHGFEQ